MGSNNRRILITTGDSDGIGWEVTSKALNALGPKSGVHFIYYRHAQSFNKKQPTLGRKFKNEVVTSLADATQQPFNAKNAIEIRSSRPPPHRVKEATRHCMTGDFQALVTAPLSKTSIVEAGLSDSGH